MGRFVAPLQRPCGGITGSAGKPQRGHWLAWVLEELGSIHQTAGNFNNHVGLPLTLLAAPQDADAWVLEMGMNHAGEIQLLQDIGKPNIRLITNVGIAHLEDWEASKPSQAPKQNCRWRTARDICRINMDDPYVSAMSIPQGVSTIGFGRHIDSQVRLTDAHVDANTLNTHFTVQMDGKKVSGMVPNPGLHMATNAASAMAVGHALGLDPAKR